MHDDENPYVTIHHRPALYLLTEEDVERIDSLTSALNLAIAEIIHRRGIRQNPFSDTPAQEDFNAQFYEALEDGGTEKENR